MANGVKDLVVIADGDHGRGTYDEGEANASFIIRACNAHEELVEACKAAKESFEQLIKINRIPENMAGYRLVCAALAKAEGK